MDTLPAVLPDATEARPHRHTVIDWLRPRRRLLFGGLAVALLLAAGTLGRPWLEALGIGSLVLSLLPCAAMCAAGLCMKGGGQCAKEGNEGLGASAEVPAPGGQATSRTLTT